MTNSISRNNITTCIFNCAYNERNDKVLMRYYADNPKLVKTYDKLIHNLFNGGNHGLEYNPKTNLYKNLK